MVARLTSEFIPSQHITTHLTPTSAIQGGYNSRYQEVAGSTPVVSSFFFARSGQSGGVLGPTRHSYIGRAMGEVGVAYGSQAVIFTSAGL